LDWDDWARRLPLQYAVMCPAMIAAENDPPHDELRRQDRLAFVEHFTSAIRLSGIPDNIAVHLPSILADDELQVFHSSILSKGAYALWVAKYCVRSARWAKAAVNALDKYVLAHPETASLPAVNSVRVHLSEMQEEG
jgi:hypothetical protein